jgi:DNA methylase
VVRSQLGLWGNRAPDSLVTRETFLDFLANFSWQGRPTVISQLDAGGNQSLPVFTNEFWTSQQRAAHSLHEISYRACFKPQLPAFFIDLFTSRGDVVFDPFAGRGTTLLEAALRGRTPAGCDVNPLSRALILPRLAPPAMADVRDRLAVLDLEKPREIPQDLLTFYHPTTLQAICAVREYLLSREADGAMDEVDEWIRMVTVNRLTGHSPGFLSVYTLPPNQATSIRAQQKINAKRKQTPPARDYRATILSKSRSLLSDVDEELRARLNRARQEALFHVGSCTDEFWREASIQLVVTSPPFLDVVDYASDNWLRCWFYGVRPDSIAIAMHASVEQWKRFIEAAFHRFHRLLMSGGFVAFEVGEVRQRSVRLEEAVIPCGVAAGLTPVAVVVNEQVFTKTANIWGVKNNTKGTNTNRIVVFQKHAST